MKETIAYHQILGVFKNRSNRFFCLHSTKWEHIYNFNKNQLKKLLLSIIFQQYSKTGQAKLSGLMQHIENKYITLTRINEIIPYNQIWGVFKNRTSILGQVGWMVECFLQTRWFLVRFPLLSLRPNKLKTNIYI